MQISKERFVLVIGCAIVLVFLLGGKSSREYVGKHVWNPSATAAGEHSPHETHHDALRHGATEGDDSEDLEEAQEGDGEGEDAESKPRQAPVVFPGKKAGKKQGEGDEDAPKAKKPKKSPKKSKGSSLYLQGPASCSDANACDCPPDYGLPTPTKEYRGYTFWSSDYHIATIADLKDVWKRMDWDVRVIDKSLSGHCHLTNTCQRDLKVFPGPGLDMPCGTAERFWDAYRNDPVMQTVDAFVCTYSYGMCEAFMPFNKSLIIVVSTRFEVGRYGNERWSNLIKNLRKIAENPRNIIAANNVFDQMYLRYFTGLGDRVLYIPSYCGYTNAVYGPKNKQILIVPRHLMSHNGQLANELIAFMSSKNTGYTFAVQANVYNHYEYWQLAQHPAMVLMPYQVSLMSFFEYYRMGIPIFSPSKRLYAEWHQKWGTFEQLTWNRVHGHPSDHSDVSRHQCAASSFRNDPNNEKSRDAMEEWFAYSDYEVFPHIMYFDSWDDLLPKLTPDHLNNVHKKMMEFNKQQEADLVVQWKSVFERVFHGVAPGGSHMPAGNFQDAVRSLYGSNFKVFPNC